MSTTLSVYKIRSLLSPYGYSADEVLCERIAIYIEMLLQWNQHISLTSLVDPEEIVRFHFGESLFAVPNVPIHDGRLADVGTGAGFPGMVLRLAVPNLKVTLIESNSKKCVFLSQTVQRLQLDGVQVFHGRMEGLRAVEVPFDFVTARALADRLGVLSWANTSLSVGGKTIFWTSEETAREVLNSANPSWAWTPPLRIPNSRRRALLIGTRV